MLSYAQAQEIVVRHGQEHVLRHWASLGSASRDRLLAQLEALDWCCFDEWVSGYVTGAPECSIPDGLRPAPYFPLDPENRAQAELYDRARSRGEELLRAGAVCAFTVAGGQGTRLGYDAPKGTYPISPIKHKSLFQLFAEMIARAQEKYGHPILWVIMTSPMNDAATQAFFTENGYFGLDADTILFSPQGTMPAFSMDGRLILAAKDSLALSPNGHGGSLLMLRQSGALERMSQMGIEHITYWQVDNPLVQPFDPLFLGLHDVQDSDMSCRSLTKTGPFEKLGNFCCDGERTIIIEYSDMPDELAQKTDSLGRLSFRAGSPAIHILRRTFVEQLTADGRLSLPFHRAEKKVPFLSDDGTCVHEPETANAVKLEMFIFDALALARHVLILEAAREESFGPVKNPDGVDSVVTCRALMNARAARWLRAAGIHVPARTDGTPDCTLELSPRTFLDVEDVRAKASGLTPPTAGSKEYYQ